MRELKFRAWDTKNKRMLRWGDDDNWKKPGDLQDDCDEWYNTSWIIFCTSLTGQGADGRILMQYTGLHDRLGVEIYEGDILSDPLWEPEDEGEIEWPFVVKFGETNDMRYGWNLTGYPAAITCAAFESLEVIGNIYEDPELLENGVPR